jgi:hypothetical protein
MKRPTIFTILIFVMVIPFIPGCQSQQEKDESAAREKMKNCGKDFTPEKFMDGKGKPEKPYWDKTR